MPDGRRRSREGWSDAMEDGPPAGPVHTHRLPPLVRAAIVGLAGAVFLLLVAVGLMAVYVYQANQYVQGRGEFRDAEAARMEAETRELIRQAQCDLLDQLPEGGLLDRPRAKYQCGPGIPLDLLSPEEQAQIGSRTTPTVPAPSSAVPLAPVPPTGSPASPAAPDPVPNKPGTPPAEPSPSPDPLVDLGPITEPICARLGVCL